jgi:hypothetical protein
MTPRNLLLAFATFGCAAAFAQAPLGTVTQVEGVVTATQGATGVTVAPGTPIQNGMRFVTTSRGSVTLRMNNGCTVSVPAGHGVTVLQSMTCQQLTAAVQPVAPVPTQAAFGGGAAGGVGGIVFGAAVAAAIVSDVTDDDDVAQAPLSPQ